MITLERADIEKSREIWKFLWNSLETPYPFLSWEWQKTWWDVFGRDEGTEYLFVARKDGKDLAIAPFVQKDKEVHWSGGTEISDYLDIVGKSVHNLEIWKEALGKFSQDKITTIILHNIPQDSATLVSLEALAAQFGYIFKKEQEDVVPYITLKESFDLYTFSLSRKHRHELRRKIRRFDETTAGKWEIKKSTHHSLDGDLDRFFNLFRMRRPQKQEFMTSKMENFFRKQTRAMLELNLLDFSTLCTGNQCVAMTIGFISKGNYYLYNSAFDPKFEASSGGFILKAMLIKECIEKKRQTFDFMQGNERYKYELGAIDGFVYKITLHRR